MSRPVERYPHIEDIISGYRRSGVTRVTDASPWERDEAPRTSPATKRPEVPHTGLSTPALSTGERLVLRRVAPAVATDLDQAERLHSSPMRQTSRSISAAVAAEDVDRLRRRAREVIGEHGAAVSGSAPS